MVVTENNQVLAQLSLPIGGLMSEESLERVYEAVGQLRQASVRLGAKIENPFMSLSFISLAVIPELKITDKGLVDVTKAGLVELFVD